jgi:hypothetical protein
LNVPKALARFQSNRRRCSVRQRFRQDEQAVAEVDRSQRGRGEEGQARIELAKIAAYGRPEDEAKTKRHAQHAERLAPRLGLGDVSDVGRGCRMRRAGNA